MKFLTILYLFGLPGVARSSQLNGRQVTPSGNSSVTLPSQSSSSSSDSSSGSSQIESTAPLLVATSITTSATSLATPTEVTTSLSLSKQERGPQDPDVTPPGPPPVLAPTIVTSPVEITPPGETSASPATTSTSIITESTTGTTTLAFSSPTIIASPEISSVQLTTISTTNTNLPPVASYPPITLITSKSTPSVVSSPTSETSGTITTTPSNSESTPSSTATATMSSPTPTPSSASSSSDGNSTSTLTIALSTILSVTGVVLIAVAAYLCTGNRRKRLPMFRIKRGITPIGDDEIATWKSNRSAEKVTDRYTARPSHSQNPSTATSTRRAPSVIQYHNGGRQSYEVASPRSFIGDGGKYSFDLPQAPGAVLARAPNARSGLTDETVPGDDPFLPSPKRHPSRLHKLPPSSPSLHGRTKGSRSSSLRSYAEAAWRDGPEQSSSPRVSSDAHARTHNRIYSNSSIPPPPRLSFGDNDQFTGLSPPPSRRNDSTIGLAVG